MQIFVVRPNKFSRLIRPTILFWVSFHQREGYGFVITKLPQPRSEHKRNVKLLHQEYHTQLGRQIMKLFIRSLSQPRLFNLADKPHDPTVRKHFTRRVSLASTCTDVSTHASTPAIDETETDFSSSSFHRPTTVSTTTTTIILRTSSASLVRFDEDANVEYEHSTDDLQLSRLWYSGRDIAGFKKENKSTVEAMRMVRKIPGHGNAAWISYLAAAYERIAKQSGRCSKRADEGQIVAKLFPKDTHQQIQGLPTELIGQDRPVVAGRILKDRKLRRKAMMTKMASIHQRSKSSKTVLVDESIAKNCMAISLPSRAYAHYIAVLTAAAQ